MASPRFNGQPNMQSHIHIYIYILINIICYIWMYIYMQLSASFYLYTYVCFCHCLSSSPCMQNATKNIWAMPIFISNQEKKHRFHPSLFLCPSIRPSQFLPPDLGSHLEVFPATPPIKECSNLWWKEHPKTLISWRSEVWPGMRQFQSNSHQDPEQKLSPSFLAQQGRDWMLFSLEILSNNRIRVANTFADLVS